MDMAAVGDEQVIPLALISEAATHLARTCRRSELSPTDIVNRAISLYEFLDEERTRGTEMLLRRRDGFCLPGRTAVTGARGRGWGRRVTLIPASGSRPGVTLAARPCRGPASPCCLPACVGAGQSRLRAAGDRRRSTGSR